MLTKDDILSAEDLPSEEVKVPEWGGSVFVRTLTGVGRDAFEQRCSDQREGERQTISGIKALLATQTVCDEHGVMLFSEADAAALNEKSGAALDRIYEVASRLSHLTKKDAKELEGN